MATRLIIVGGFLGAGKTTLLLQSARLLSERGYRVGMVTNDQGQDLVDTRLLAQKDYPVTEVAGSCFCCAFPDLLQALRSLQDTVQPDVVLAEPVGSCTDLVATVLRPLEAYYPGQFEIAPLTVLVDATRELGQFSFSANVSYLFDRQLEEAGIILLNKIDLVDSDTQTQKVTGLQGKYNRARTLGVAARTSDGLDAWLNMTLGQTHANDVTMTVDYERYAVAEAELGWLNAKGTVRSSTPFSARQWMTELLDRIGQELADSQIAHIKAHVSNPQTTFKASMTQQGYPLSWDVNGDDLPSDQLDFILNARVNIDPERLQQAAQASLDAVKPDPLARLYVTHFECFKPLPPRPTYRLGGADH